MLRRSRFSRYPPAAAVLLCLCTLTAVAQDDVIERQLKAAPGRDVRAGVFTDIRPDCTSGPLPAIRLATPPAHGNVTVKRGTLRATNIKQCLAIEVPAFVAFYRAAADYSGADDFELEISSPNGHKRRERVHVTVTKSSSAGEGI
ncbi:MAG TPA: hypothetical protein VK337_12485 [Xanthobacteraceae bacterium]|nr:hypothetical protein [Xanthobacteraceae bacterium]